MGRGNECIDGKYEGLYYVDKDYLDVYYNKKTKKSVLRKELSCQDYDYSYIDIDNSNDNYKDFVLNLKSDLIERFKSLDDCTDIHGTILENGLFTIEIVDNQWSYAIKLLQKEDEYYNNGNIENLQKKHYQNYLNGIRDCLFNQIDEIGTYCGPYTHGTIEKSA